MDILHRIAWLILEDPFLTANQIARRLGYAEPKTIYYWLGKARYGGLNAFKRAVLEGHFRPVSAGGAAEAKASYSRHIPIVDDFTASGEPVHTSERLLVWYAPPDVLFAWRYPGHEVAHFLPGDLLLAAEVNRERSGQWAIAFTQARRPVLRWCHAYEGGLVLIDPFTHSLDVHSTVGYRLCQLFRRL